jgi:long-chain acyl-CoA synthetase
LLLYDLLTRGVAQHPGKPAIIFRDAPITYSELYLQVNRMAHALRERGIEAGERVGVLLPNCPQFTVTYYAATALGAVCVPANPMLKPPELAHIWGDSDVRLVVTIPALLSIAEEARKSAPTVKTVVSIGTRAETPNGTVTFGEMLAASASSEIDVRGFDRDMPAVCIYTSGTTGRPKGALLSHRNLTANCRQIGQFLEFVPADNFICMLPLFHSFAGTVCQNTPLYVGSTLTMIEQFLPGRVFDAIERHRVTLMVAVPAMYGALLQYAAAHEVDVSTVRLAVSGGAPMPIPMISAIEQGFGCILLEGDGPTECSPVTAANPPIGVRKPGTIGIPVSGVEMRIFDEADREVSVGQVGEIVVRGENVMLGYHNMPEETADAMRSGWYHTGDLGKVDEDGYFSIVDRKKDMLIVGGINVYPREIEEVLHTHPAIADVAVVGRHSDVRGEEPLAIVVLREGAEATERELVQFCRRQLANYKVPRGVVIRTALPRSDTGKVLKRLLRKEMEME